MLSHLEGTMWIIGVLLYGSGLRLEECVELRVKDVDFDRNQITVRRGKGQKDRTTMLPAALVDPQGTAGREKPARSPLSVDSCEPRRVSAAPFWIAVPQLLLPRRLPA